MMDTALVDLIDRLNRAYGPQEWWPADDAFEMIVGAILTQRVAWRNADAAIDSLRAAGMLSVQAIDAASTEGVGERIRASGFYRAKARTLKAVSAYILRRHNGSAEQLRRAPLETLRKDLLDIAGIGPETADAILVYAAGKPSFVVDAYTVRIVTRIEGSDMAPSYDRIQARFMEVLAKDAALYGQAHALLVRHGQRVCTKRAPRCGGCVLADRCAYKELLNGRRER